MRDKDGNYCVRVNEGVPLLIKGPNGAPLAKVLLARRRGRGNRKVDDLLVIPEECNDITVLARSLEPKGDT